MQNTFCKLFLTESFVCSNKQYLDYGSVRATGLFPQTRAVLSSSKNIYSICPGAEGSRERKREMYLFITVKKQLFLQA